jgi:predicted regulator of Ras-like GTPase activity (Roadblock/LC7/MglB family)
MLGPMDANRAIADLTEISPQVRDVVIAGPGDTVVGTNTPPPRAERLVAGARRLLEAADGVRGQAVAQLEAATTVGSVFVVRDGDRIIVATTSAEPTVGLVFYDLKTCVRSLSEPSSHDAAA